MPSLLKKYYYPLNYPRKNSLKSLSKIKFWHLTFYFKFLPTSPLRPIWPNNTRPPRITAAAGTKLAGTSFSSTVIFLLDERVLQPLFYSLPENKIPALTLSVLLDQDFSHCPIFLTAALLKSGPCLSPSVADRSLKPATDRGLGKPLPYQQANQAWAHP